MLKDDQAIRAIPKDLPPRSTVYGYFDLWDWDGALLRIHEALYVACREKEGREASPTAAIIDSESVKSAEKGARRSTPPATTRGRKSRARSAIFLSMRKVSRCTRSFTPRTSEIVKRSDHAKGFVVLLKRWVVERTFAWLGRCRRLAKDWECLSRRGLAFLRLASIRFMLRRLCNPA
jgi:putative transposase